MEVISTPEFVAHLQDHLYRRTVEEIELYLKNFLLLLCL